MLFCTHADVSHSTRASHTAAASSQPAGLLLLSASSVAADAGNIEADARAHCRADVPRLPVDALRASGAVRVNAVHHSLEVLQQVLVVERSLAEKDVHDTLFVRAVLNLPSLKLTHRLFVWFSFVAS